MALWSSSKFLEKIGDVKIKNVEIKCEDAVGYLAVDKIFFIATLFFLFMSLKMMGVKNSRDPQWILIIRECNGAFFMPHNNFGPTWMYF